MVTKVLTEHRRSGILEKDGPHLPLGTDLLNVRYAVLHAADKE